MRRTVSDILNCIFIYKNLLNNTIFDASAEEFGHIVFDCEEESMEEFEDIKDVLIKEYNYDEEDEQIECVKDLEESWPEVYCMCVLYYTLKSQAYISIVSEHGWEGSGKKFASEIKRFSYTTCKFKDTDNNAYSGLRFRKLRGAKLCTAYSSCNIK
jgi:hypothetical protein